MRKDCGSLYHSCPQVSSLGIHKSRDQRKVELKVSSRAASYFPDGYEAKPPCSEWPLRNEALIIWLIYPQVLLDLCRSLRPQIPSILLNRGRCHLNPSNISALLSELDDCTRVELEEILVAEGLRVSDVNTTSHLLASVMEDRPDLVFLPDTILPVGTLEVLPLLRRLTRALIVVIGPGDETTVANSLLQGADIYVKTPLRRRDFVARLNALLRRYRPGNSDDADQGPSESFILNGKPSNVHGGSLEAFTGRIWGSIHLMNRILQPIVRMKACCMSGSIRALRTIRRGAIALSS